MKEKNPYISIVIAARNDDYRKGGFLRMEMAICNLIEQSKKYNLNTELIIVDWNPPKDKPLLKDALQLPQDTGPLMIRFIVVPFQVHERYKPSLKINIINTAAFNVGIRRAKGEFVMATNSDIMFSNELAEFLSRRNLDNSRFYRAFRYDVDRKVLKTKFLQERMDFCKNNVVQAFLENTILRHPYGVQHPVLQTDCGGDFILFTKEAWFALHGYPENNNLGFASDVLLCYMAYLHGLKETVLDKSMRVYHIDHDSRWRNLQNSGLGSVVKSSIYNNLPKESKIRLIMHIVNKMRVKTFDFFSNLFYKQMGGFLTRFIPKSKRDFNIRFLLFEHRKVLFEMLRGKRSHIYNGQDWGFPNEAFLEFIK